MGKKTIASRLAQLVPYSKEKKKKVVKTVLKTVSGKLSTYLKSKKKNAEKAKTKAEHLPESKKCLPIEDGPPGEAAKQPLHTAVGSAAETAAPAEKSLQTAFAEEWRGRLVRVLDRGSGVLWRGTTGTVQKVDFSKQTCMVSMKGAPTVTAHFASKDLYKLSGAEKVPMTIEVDKRRIMKEQKEQCWKALGGEPKYVKPAQSVEHPELFAFWQILQEASRQALDVGSTRAAAVYLDPGTGLCLSLKLEGDDPLKEWRDQLAAMKAASEAQLVALPVHGGGHWSLLVWTKQAGESKHTCKYYDSLPGGGSACRETAKKLVSIVTMLLEESSEHSEEALPQTQCPVRQTDAWSCGFHIMTIMEEEMRQHRGEGQTMVIRQVDATRKLVNQWVDMLLKWKKSEDVKKGTVTAAPPPPLPPPPPELEKPVEEEEHVPKV